MAGSCSVAEVEQPKAASAAGRQGIGAPAGKAEQKRDPEKIQWQPEVNQDCSEQT